MPIDVFISYCHNDEALYHRLSKHLKPLEYEGLIRPWSDRRIAPGAHFDTEILSALENAHIVLLLISPDFVASEYCWSVEMERALGRHETAKAKVIPVILRPVDWHSSPFGKLLALPKDGRPVVSWPDPDDALLNVAQSIRGVATKLPGVAMADSSKPGAISSDAAIAVERVSENAKVTISLSAVLQIVAVSSASRYRILVDGRPIDASPMSGVIRFRVQPGYHTVQLKFMFLTKSNLFVFHAEDDAEIDLEVDVSRRSDSASLLWRSAEVWGLSEAFVIRNKNKK